MRERIVSGAFDTNVETDSQQDGARTHEILFKAREQLIQRPLAAEQQPVDVPRLRRPRSMRRLRGQIVALQHNNAIEAIGERTCRGEPAHSSADHDRLLANPS